MSSDCRPLFANAEDSREKGTAASVLVWPQNSRDLMKLLHLCHDEKVIPFVQRLYEEALPKQNQFRIWGPRPGSSSRYAQLGPNAELVPKSYWYSRRMRREVKESDILIVHYLTPTFARAIRVATKRQMVVWCGWGGDYFDLLNGYSNQLYLPNSRRLDEQSFASRLPIRWSAGIKRIIKWPINRLETLDDSGWISRTLPRIDWFVEGPQAHRLLASSRPEFRAGRHWIPYYCVEDMPEPPSGGCTGDNILLGNSATATNNHVEAMQSMSQLDLAGRQVIVPLSYGSRDYARHVSAIGRRLLGSAFVPLTDFIPLSEYLRLLQTCSVMVMNHVRAQGVGNIVAALLNGSHVFLRPENILMDFFRERGIAISDWQDRPVSQTIPVLDADSRSRNRREVQQWFGWSNAVRKVDELTQLRLPEVYAFDGQQESSRRLLERVLWMYNAVAEQRPGLDR